MRDSERARQVAERVAEKIRDVTPERLGSDGWEFTRQHVQHAVDLLVCCTTTDCES